MGTLTWSISVGSLPPGLTGLPSTGPSVTISGTPTSQGTFPFTVRVTDSLGQSDTRALSITINLPPPLNITTTSLPAGSIGQTYSQTVAATWGIGSTDRSISARDTAAGPQFGSRRPARFPERRSCRQAHRILPSEFKTQSDKSTRKSYRSRSTYPTPANITTTTLPEEAVGQATYNEPVVATGGTAPLTWSISAGTLPQGLNLNATTGTITGAPTETGTFPFTVRVADTFGQSDTQALSIHVRIIQPAPDHPPLAARRNSRCGLRSNDGTGNRRDWHTYLEYLCGIAPTRSHEVPP